MTRRSQAVCSGMLCGALPIAAWAHQVAGSDAAYLQSVHGVQVGPLAYLGAKHMMTGYDHLLYLAGITFFLYRLRDVAAYVTLFAVGHSITLLLGVLAGVHVDAHAVDAVIGLSVVYKAVENIGGLRRPGWSISPRAAVLAFGLAHGLGLATKLQELHLPTAGLVGNMLAFNVGVELGQLAALILIWLVLQAWRRRPAFARQALVANVVLMGAGFVLFEYQLTALLLTRAH